MYSATERNGKHYGANLTKERVAWGKYVVNAMRYFQIFSGPSCLVDIAIGYGLDGPGIESRWGGEIFRTCPDRPWGPPSLLYNVYRVFSGGKERPRRDADPSPPSSAVLKRE
jgi:hypothetical protein